MNDSATGSSARGKPGKATGLVPFVFAIAGVAELPGTVLKRLLTDIGMTPSAAHALLARLRTDGLLSSTRRGRDAYYRLAGSLAAGYERVRTAEGTAPCAWTGGFHALLYQVPEAHRAFRDMLRRGAQVHGYGQLQPGVLIAVSDRSAAFGHILDAAPAAARVLHSRLELAADAARQVAYEAWELGDLEATYREHIRALRAAVRGRTRELPPDPATLRRYTALLSGPLTDTVRDPNLPAELLPANWPRATLFTAIGEVNRRFWPAANAYVRTLLTP